jgi:hypothetical protein
VLRRLGRESVRSNKRDSGKTAFHLAQERRQNTRILNEPKHRLRHDVNAGLPLLGTFLSLNRVLTVGTNVQ